MSSVFPQSGTKTVLLGRIVSLAYWISFGCAWVWCHPVLPIDHRCSQPSSWSAGMPPKTAVVLGSHCAPLFPLDAWIATVPPPTMAARATALLRIIPRPIVMLYRVENTYTDDVHSCKYCTVLCVSWDINDFNSLLAMSNSIVDLATALSFYIIWIWCMVPLSE